MIPRQEQAHHSSVVTVDEFIDELRRVRDSFHWHFEPDIRPGSERRAWPRFWIRGSIRGAETEKMDPVQAVAYALTGKQESWKEAAKTIGLSSGDAEAIIGASTDVTWREVDGRRRPDKKLQSLRVKLLETVGDRMRVPRRL